MVRILKSYYLVGTSLYIIMLLNSDPDQVGLESCG